MNDATMKTIQYLTTAEGKADFKARVADELAHVHLSDPYRDRAWGNALTDIYVACGGDWDDVSSDDILDTFGYYTSRWYDDEQLMGSRLPSIIARCKKFDSLAKHLIQVLP